MKRLFIIVAIILFLSLPLFGGEMYVVKYKMDADVVVYLTDNGSDADLWVVVTDIGSYAKNHDHYWKFVNYKNSQTVKVYFTKYKREADIIVCYSRYFVGWKKSNKFQGRLH
jgi:hypothetical protein